MTFAVFALNLWLFIIVAKLFDLTFAGYPGIALIEFLVILTLTSTFGPTALLNFVLLTVQFIGIYFSVVYFGDSMLIPFMLTNLLVNLFLSIIAYYLLRPFLATLLLLNNIILISTLDFLVAQSNLMTYAPLKSLIIPLSVGFILANISLGIKYSLGYRKKTIQ